MNDVIDLSNLSDEDLEDGTDCANDCITQYQSECALYGDAGPGQALDAAYARRWIAAARAVMAARYPVASPDIEF